MEARRTASNVQLGGPWGPVVDCLVSTYYYSLHYGLEPVALLLPFCHPASWVMICILEMGRTESQFGFVHSVV